MNNSLQHWQEFWGNQSVPLHRSDTEEHYDLLAAELRLLFDDSRANRVLEIGCGNGALYRPLGFENSDDYRGVDFSPAMLDRFRERFPAASLVNASGHSYRDDQQYDLIFSNGVVQYFDRAMLEEHFDHASSMLAASGVMVCASVPWKHSRVRYLQGRFSSRRPSTLRSLLGLARTMRADSMGHWFEWSDFERLAERHDLDCRFYGSLHYPYRFHVVLRRGTKCTTTVSAK